MNAYFAKNLPRCPRCGSYVLAVDGGNPGTDRVWCSYGRDGKQSADQCTYGIEVEVTVDEHASLQRTADAGMLAPDLGGEG